jgi:hypothetical protein
VSLPDDPVMQLLAKDYVVGWSNIEKADFVGTSNGYSAKQTAVGTTNGAGGRNVQLVVLSPDGVVLHVLPGFWHPDDLADELRFGKQIHRLWLDEALSLEQKTAMFGRMHRSFIDHLSADTLARSDWQGFDRMAEMQRLAHEKRDTAVYDGTGKPVVDRNGAMTLEPLCVVAHRRMQQQPFRQLKDFDMEAFTDYGLRRYDNNSGLDKGKRFAKAEENELEREKAEAKAAAERTKNAEKDAKKKPAKGV